MNDMNDIEHGKEVNEEFTYYFTHDDNRYYWSLYEKIDKLIADKEEFLITIKKCKLNSEDVFLQTR